MALLEQRSYTVYRGIFNSRERFKGVVSSCSGGWNGGVQGAGIKGFRELELRGSTYHYIDLKLHLNTHTKFSLLKPNLQVVEDVGEYLVF